MPPAVAAPAPALAQSGSQTRASRVQETAHDFRGSLHWPFSGILPLPGSVVSSLEAEAWPLDLSLLSGSEIFLLGAAWGAAAALARETQGAGEGPSRAQHDPEIPDASGRRASDSQHLGCI